jgi:excisionase family DNA binding protein
VCVKLSSGSIIEIIEKAERALTARELANILHVNPMTVYRLARLRAGAIPAFKVGNSLRFDPKAVASWLQQQMYSALPLRARRSE